MGRPAARRRGRGDETYFCACVCEAEAGKQERSPPEGRTLNSRLYLAWKLLRYSQALDLCGIILCLVNNNAAEETTGGLKYS